MRQNPKFVLTPLAAGIATALAPAPTIAASEVALEEIGSGRPGQHPGNIRRKPEGHERQGPDGLLPICAFG